MSRNGRRCEVIMAGIGGKGVLLAGQMLASAGVQKYRHVVWTPTYFAAMRSGACECTVVLSPEEIASPILPKSDVVMVFEPSQLADFEARVRPGGLLVVESAGLPDEMKGGDYRLMQVPAVETAVRMGDSRASNMVLLGAYVAATGAVEPELVEAEVQRKFQNSAPALDLNLGALRIGFGLAERARSKR